MKVILNKHIESKTYFQGKSIGILYWVCFLFLALSKGTQFLNIDSNNAKFRHSYKLCAFLHFQLHSCLFFCKQLHFCNIGQTISVYGHIWNKHKIALISTNRRKIVLFCIIELLLCIVFKLVKCIQKKTTVLSKAISHWTFTLDNNFVFFFTVNDSHCHLWISIGDEHCVDIFTVKRDTYNGTLDAYILHGLMFIFFIISFFFLSCFFLKWCPIRLHEWTCSIVSMASKYSFLYSNL